MRNRFVGAALAALLSTSAIAQVNVVPQTGLVTATLRQNTYGAISIGLVPAATATDIFCISGSATKTVKVHRVTISGTAGTAITTPVVILRRTSLDTGGTAATSLALPVAGKFDSSSPAATAVLTAYTANPTINDSSPTYLAAPAVSFAVTTTASDPDDYHFGSNVGLFSQQVILRGAAQQMCLNLNGVSVAAGVLAISVQWTEE